MGADRQGSGTAGCGRAVKPYPLRTRQPPGPTRPIGNQQGRIVGPFLRPLPARTDAAVATHFVSLWLPARLLPSITQEHPMLKYALIFAVISLIAGALGFTGVAAGSAGIAKILFVLFLVIAVIFVVLAVLGVGAARKALK